MDQKQLIQTELTVSAGTLYKRSVFISTLNFPSAENDTNLYYLLKVLPCVMLCSFQFALRNTLSFKLNFRVQIYFCVLCDSRVQKRNSEFNLSFWPHPRITSRCIPRARSRLQAAHVLIRITCKSKKNCL